MTLTPSGTARARFDRADPGRYPSELIASLSARDVDEAHLALAHEIASLVVGLDAAAQRALTLWILALYGAMEAGSTLLPSDDVARTLTNMGVPLDDAQVAQALARAPLDPALGRIIGPAGAAVPLVLGPSGLQPQAAWVREGRVSAWLAAERASTAQSAAPPEAVSAALEDVLVRAPRKSGQPMRLNDEQRAAVRAATGRRLAVVSGGPGTGKTSIVVAILRVLVRLGVPVDRIALAAPTGKAMHRLQSSITEALGSVESPSTEDLQLRVTPPVAQTLHRLLGYQPHLGDYAWGARHRLPFDVVIVDEGSMIDLALVDRLLQALADGARLVLLGDADQLPSVEAGAVFRDLVGTGDGPARVRLTESYRMRTDDPAGALVYQVAQAVNAGDAARVEQLVVRRAHAPELTHQGVEHLELSRATELVRALQLWTDRKIVHLGEHGPRERSTSFGQAHNAIALRRGVPEVAHGERLGHLLRHAERARILCVTRSAARPTGVDAINTHIRAYLRRRQSDAQPTLMRTAPYWAPGDPVLVERNDYARNLWNGDFGIVVRTQERGHDSELVVAFQPEPGRFVFHPVAALRGDITHAWAMTVHKAQGSELEEAMVVLPWDPIPLMTREIVYTAVSRAKKGVAIVGPSSVLRVAIERRLSRRSGLAASSLP